MENTISKQSSRLDSITREIEDMKQYIASSSYSNLEELHQVLISNNLDCLNNVKDILSARVDYLVANGEPEQG